MQVMQISFCSMFPCEAMLLISGKLVSDKPGTVQSVAIQLMALVLLFFKSISYPRFGLIKDA